LLAISTRVSEKLSIIRERRDLHSIAGSDSRLADARRFGLDQGSAAPAPHSHLSQLQRDIQAVDIARYEFHSADVERP
jgi:hypothetical protein